MYYIGMLDIKFIRENKDVVQAGAKKKHIDINIDALITLDDKRRETLTSIEKKRAEQNAISEKIPTATPEIRQQMITNMKVVKESLQIHVYLFIKYIKVRYGTGNVKI